MKILFTLNIPEHLKKLQEEQFPKETFYYETNGHFANLQEVDTIVTYGSNLTEEIVEQATNLKFIMVFSAGVDSLPRKIIQEKKIKVANVRGIHAIPMGEYALSFMLAHVKKASFFNEMQKNKRWESEEPIMELAGKTLAVAGTGAIGAKVAEFAQAFDMNLIGVNTTGHAVKPFNETYPITELEKVAPLADFFVSVLPQTDQTTNLYQLSFFKQMKNNAVFINIGRGNAVALDVLETAAKEKFISHFYLDVLPEEPLPKENYLWQATNITITPHVSGHSDKYLERSFDIWLENIIHFKENTKLRNEIDLDKGY
ncbi:dehydrogenase [Listeria seeligeri]|uniref:NAD(P)-dependent oxidoreductase n=1 Tax=Listeria seeligeri TaxID=1640 RepID=UPI001629E930|nr:NAD(P)-dependent oxidoreductase [Listeria seeligeri]MBC1422715.1 dehydrogenase [Listeria seeligeri]MBC1752459.1 dehydrogenase [Listeria seeligeri]MBC1830760.1 dehydrogenase [Listeria seeligeri]MBC1845078.1 dehydrogenase [Listeria seeligeri]MBC2232586.1 dehydrogenase [Listeria seeligeri]